MSGHATPTEPGLQRDDLLGDAVVRLISRRRTTREGFEPRSVPDDLVRKILQCGLSAPSSKDAQPWRFHVVQDRETLAELAEAVVKAEGIESYVPHDPATGLPGAGWVSTVIESAEVLRIGGTAVFVENQGVFGGGRRGLLRATHEHVLSSLVGYGLEMMGLGAAIQNMLIAAEALGIQAAFIGDIMIAEEVIRARLGMTGDMAGAVILGFSALTPPSKQHSADDPRRVRWH